MQERGLQPNVYIYNALIKAQAGTGNIGEVNAAALLHFAVLPGPIRSMLLHSNQLGYTFDGTSDGQACLALSIDALRRDNARAGVTGRKRAVCTHVQALQVFDAMIESDVRPDGATWQTLLSQSKYVGRYDVADLVRPQYCPA